MLQTQLAIASVFLGQHATHALPDKISAGANNSIQGIEITYTDPKNYARSLSISITEAACAVRRQCQANNLTIIAFAPFKDYGGRRTRVEEHLAKAQ